MMWLAFLILQVAAEEAAVTKSAPDVIVIVLDDISNDRLKVYQEYRIPEADMPVTPNIDAVAAAGVRLTGFYACPWCSPSRAAMMTGMFPAHTQVGEFLRSYECTAMADLPTIGDVFSAAGYETLFAGKWHLDPVETSCYDPSAPNRRGWKRFAGVPANAGDYYDWTLVEDGVESEQTTYRPEVLAAKAEQLWAEARSPKILWAALSLPHRPVHDPPQALATHPVGSGDLFRQWVTMIEAMDHSVGRIAALADEQDFLFIVSDNGDITPGATFSDWPESKGSLKEPGINVPFLARGPGIAAGRVDDTLVAAYDVFPTLCRIAGIEGPAVDGRSFDGVLLGVAPAPRPYTWVHSFAPNGVGPFTTEGFALIEAGGWKLIRIDGTDQLYQLTTPGWDGDPVQNPAEAGRLARVLDAIIAGF